jgi:hypothetical protein
MPARGGLGFVGRKVPSSAVHTIATDSVVVAIRMDIAYDDGVAVVVIIIATAAAIIAAAAVAVHV